MKKKVLKNPLKNQSVSKSVTFVQAPSGSADSRLLKSYSPGKGVPGTLEDF